MVGLVVFGTQSWFSPDSSDHEITEVPEWVVFPEAEWQKESLHSANIDSVRFSAWMDSLRPEFGQGYGGQKPDTGGVMITYAGRVIQEWGDVNYRFQSASLGKTFTRMALQLAIDKGLIASEDDRIYSYWTGEGGLDAHKVLNEGKHKKLTFKHLIDMEGGFPVTNGFYWKNRVDDQGNFYPGIPEWAEWTGDPAFDNYAHITPGKHRHYSSGGYWRLSQALTAVWDKDLKRVLDEHIMQKIGIPSERWEWLSGKEVLEDHSFYPELPGYGLFIDPPFEIEGERVLGGGGWVVMSASDFARIGHLIATGGFWKGERLISNIVGNRGVGANTMDGWHLVVTGDTAHSLKEGFFSIGKVATHFDDPSPAVMEQWMLNIPQTTLSEHYKQNLP